jgi:hypothetical protein
VQGLPYAVHVPLWQIKATCESLPLQAVAPEVEHA